MCSGWLSIRRFRALDMPAQPDPKRPRCYQASSPDSGHRWQPEPWSFRGKHTVQCRYQGIVKVLPLQKDFIASCTPSL